MGTCCGVGVWHLSGQDRKETCVLELENSSLVSSVTQKKERRCLCRVSRCADNGGWYESSHLSVSKERIGHCGEKHEARNCE